MFDSRYREWDDWIGSPTQGGEGLVLLQCCSSAAAVLEFAAALRGQDCLRMVANGLGISSSAFP